MSLLQSIANARKTLNGLTDANFDNLTVESKVKLNGSETGISVSDANHTADLTICKYFLQFVLKSNLSKLLNAR